MRLSTFPQNATQALKWQGGERIIFLNDDVEAGQRDWIENIIEPLQNQDVGAVAPKLLYPTGRIQHAGLVTGVRGLVGTAMHQWPGDSVDYTNFAQSMRTVSALSAACLAMRRADFFALGGFDEVNTPIAHSDLDLCFKVREAGMRCVYTPFATMTHHGHVSIGAEKRAAEVQVVDKSTFFFCNGGRSSPVTILTTLITCEIGCTAIRPSRFVCSRAGIPLAQIQGGMFC
jgi:Predicted glycosyltransferases